MIPAPQGPVGKCRYGQYIDDGACDGTQLGQCSNVLAGTNVGLCQECNATGSVQVPMDDEDCGVIDCSGWYAHSGVWGRFTTQYCYSKQAISADRCKDLGQCAEPNSPDCDSQAEDVLQYQCGDCQVIDGDSCDGTNLGQCSNSANGPNYTTNDCLACRDGSLITCRWEATLTNCHVADWNNTFSCNVNNAGRVANDKSAHPCTCLGAVCTGTGSTPGSICVCD